MNFGTRLRDCRKDICLTRSELAGRLGVSPSAIGNYETGISFPKEDVLLRLFNALHTTPNELFQDSFQTLSAPLTHGEKHLLEQYRSLPAAGREAARTMLSALCLYQEEQDQPPQLEETRSIPLYLNPAAAGYAAPVFGEDFDYLPVTEDIPRGAEFGVRIQGDSMEPHIHDGSVVYVNHDPLTSGDVGIFYVDGDMLCKQYYHDPAGMVYLYSLNRKRADADVVFGSDSGRTLVCFGRVMMHGLPLPGKGG